MASDLSRSRDLWSLMRAAAHGPFMEITEEEVGEHRTRGTLGYLVSLMLYPDDESRRRQLAAAEATAILGGVSNEVFTGSGGRVIARMLREAPHLYGGLDPEKERR